MMGVRCDDCGATLLPGWPSECPYCAAGKVIAPPDDWLLEMRDLHESIEKTVRRATGIDDAAMGRPPVPCELLMMIEEGRIERHVYPGGREDILLDGNVIAEFGPMELVTTSSPDGISMKLTQVARHPKGD